MTTSATPCRRFAVFLCTLIGAATILLCARATSAQVPFEVLHTFTGHSDPRAPVGALVDGGDGNLYGITAKGGVSDRGTIFRMAPDASVTVLHQFSEAEGCPVTLMRASTGDFYGVTSSPFCFHVPTSFFRMTPDGTFTIVRSSLPGPGCCEFRPGTPLVEAPDGTSISVADQSGD